MTVKVDPNTCIGCGLCTGICQGVFELTDANVAAVVAQPTAAQEADTQTAIDSCPVSAISKE